MKFTKTPYRDMQNRLNPYNDIKVASKEAIFEGIVKDLKKLPLEEHIKYIFLFSLEKKIDLPTMTDDEKIETNNLLFEVNTLQNKLIENKINEIESYDLMNEQFGEECLQMRLKLTKFANSCLYDFFVAVNKTSDEFMKGQSMHESS